MRALSNVKKLRDIKNADTASIDNLQNKLSNYIIKKGKMQYVR